MIEYHTVCIRTQMPPKPLSSTPQPRALTQGDGRKL